MKYFRYSLKGGVCVWRVDALEDIRTFKLTEKFAYYLPADFDNNLFISL